MTLLRLVVRCLGFGDSNTLSKSRVVVRLEACSQAESPRA